jgi:hypothetical protein
MSNNEVSEKIKALDTPDMHQTFLRSQWEEFAAFGWASFLKEGRGAIVINLKRASFDASGLQMPAFYVAEGSQSLARQGGWPSEEIAQVVREYDPELEVVFLVWRLDDEMIHYIAMDEITPRLSYEAKQAGSKK